VTRTRVLLAGLLVVVGSTIFAACASESSPAAPVDPVLAEGQQIFNSNCASCHGAAGGGGYGKKLAGTVETNYPNIADEIAVITNGKGSMPAFGKKLTAEQIEAVALYTRWLPGPN
jgi:cytochrome c oxidase subunit 2